MVTLQTADNALKSAYLDVVSEQLNYNVNPFLAKIKRTAENVVGKDVRQVIRFGVNGGVGVGDETGDLPKANGNLYDQICVPLKNLYGTIEISDKAVRASENNTGAFVNLLNAEMDGLIKASSINLGRMLFGRQDGYLGEVIERTTGQIVQVYPITNFYEGMTVDFYYCGELKCPGVRIIGVDRLNGTIKVEKRDDFVADTDGTVHLQGSKDNELIGLSEIFSYSDTLYGLSRSDHTWLKPHEETAPEGSINEMVMQRVVDYLEDNYGSTVDMILCSSGVKRALMEHLSAYRRNVDYMELKGGFKAMSFNGIPVVSDRFCPYGTMYFLNSKDFTLHQLCDWKWLEGEDGKILKQLPNKPVYQATLVKYAELICSRPCGQGVIKNITEK